jgi:heme exporter protein C
MTTTSVSSTRRGTIPAFSWLPWVGFAGVLGLIGAQVLGVVSSPPEVGMGHLQKILYVHLPVVWMAFIAFFVVFVASVSYLVRGNERHDLLAASAAEVGTVLIGLTLALGSIWAKPTWGVWWTWDPRLTTTAILFVTFVGYLALRAFTEDAARRARWSAAVGILAALNVPIVYMSVRWWRTIHQVQSSPATVDPSYVLSLRTNAIAFLVLLIYFIGRRYQAARLERERERVIEEAALRQGGVHV